MAAVREALKPTVLVGWARRWSPVAGCPRHGRRPPERVVDRGHGGTRLRYGRHRRHRDRADRGVAGSCDACPCFSPVLTGLPALTRDDALRSARPRRGRARRRRSYGDAAWTGSRALPAGRDQVPHGLCVGL